MSVLIQAPAKHQNKPLTVTHSPSNGLPPLQSGDRLSRAEFERRYIEHPEIKKAELIEGVVYVTSPVYAQHGLPHSAIIGWLTVYGAVTPNIYIADNTSLRLDLDNEVQPDVCVWIDEHCGGQTHIAPEGFIEGTPELVVEVAASSAAHDLNDKLRIYRRNRVREYLVLLAYERELRYKTVSHTCKVWDTVL